MLFLNFIELYVDTSPACKALDIGRYSPKLSIELKFANFGTIKLKLFTKWCKKHIFDKGQCHMVKKTLSYATKFISQFLHD